MSELGKFTKVKKFARHQAEPGRPDAARACTHVLHQAKRCAYAQRLAQAYYAVAHQCSGLSSVSKEITYDTFAERPGGACSPEPIWGRAGDGHAWRFVDVSDFRPVPDNQEVLYFRRYQSLNSSAACHLRRCSPLALQVFTDASVDQSFITEVLVRSVCAAARSTNPLARG